MIGVSESTQYDEGGNNMNNKLVFVGKYVINCSMKDGNLYLKRWMQNSSMPAGKKMIAEGVTDYIFFLRDDTPCILYIDKDMQLVYIRADELADYKILASFAGIGYKLNSIKAVVIDHTIHIFMMAEMNASCGIIHLKLFQGKWQRKLICSFDNCCCEYEIAAGNKCISLLIIKKNNQNSKCYSIDWCIDNDEWGKLKEIKELNKINILPSMMNTDNGLMLAWFDKKKKLLNAMIAGSDKVYSKNVQLTDESMPAIMDCNNKPYILWLCKKKIYAVSADVDGRMAACLQYNFDGNEDIFDICMIDGSMYKNVPVCLEPFKVPGINIIFPVKKQTENKISVLPISNNIDDKNSLSENNNGRDMNLSKGVDRISMLLSCQINEIKGIADKLDDSASWDLKDSPVMELNMLLSRVNKTQREIAAIADDICSINYSFDDSMLKWEQILIRIDKLDKRLRRRKYGIFSKIGRKTEAYEKGMYNCQQSL